MRFVFLFLQVYFLLSCVSPQEGKISAGDPNIDTIRVEIKDATGWYYVAGMKDVKEEKKVILNDERIFIVDDEYFNKKMVVKVKRNNVDITDNIKLWSKATVMRQDFFPKYGITGLILFYVPSDEELKTLDFDDDAVWYPISLSENAFRDSSFRAYFKK